MRKFAAKCVFLVVPILLISIAASCIKLSDNYLIYKTDGTSYSKISYNINIINSEPEAIRDAIIFLGPSLVQSGISDDYLYSQGIPVVNMAINHPGKEIELYFLKRLSHIKPRTIFVFANYETNSIHPMTPILYDPFSLLAAGQIFNMPFMKYYAKRLTFVSDYLKWCLFERGAKRDINKRIGFGVVYNKDSYTDRQFDMIRDEVIQLKTKREQSAMRGSSVVTGVFKYIKKCINKNYLTNSIINNESSQHNFMLSMIEEANGRNIEIAGIYIPTIEDAVFGTHCCDTLLLNTSIGVKSLDDYRFLSNGRYWFDKNHLSREGAILFTHELLTKNILGSN
jgi:hypothetical protein